MKYRYRRYVPINTHSHRSSTTDPPCVVPRSERPSIEFTAPGQKDVSGFDPVVCKGTCLGLRNAGDPVGDDSVVPHIHWHNDRYAFRFVVRLMKLSAEWPYLNAFTVVAKRGQWNGLERPRIEALGPETGDHALTTSQTVRQSFNNPVDRTHQ